MADLDHIPRWRRRPPSEVLLDKRASGSGRTFLDQWDERLGRHRGHPRAQLRAVMTYLAERTTAEGYRGCPFINFCAEFPTPDHPGRKVARATKAALRDRFLSMAEALDPANPRQLADGLLLLVEGAYAASQTFGCGIDGPGHALVAAADALASIRPSPA